jgi:RNA-directed DNA polymerase
MLETLEQSSVRGGKWHSLIDNVYKKENLLSAYREVAANKGAPGVDHVTASYNARAREFQPACQ